MFFFFVFMYYCRVISLIYLQWNNRVSNHRYVHYTFIAWNQRTKATLQTSETCITGVNHKRGAKLTFCIQIKISILAVYRCLQHMHNKGQPFYSGSTWDYSRIWRKTSHCKLHHHIGWTWVDVLDSWKWNLSDRRWRNVYLPLSATVRLEWEGQVQNKVKWVSRSQQGLSSYCI